MSFFKNTRKPKGLGGKIMVVMMNLVHSALADWGLQYLNIPTDADILDVGCGGGANIRKLLKLSPNGTVKGIDYSEISVEMARKVNAKEIQSERCEVLQANVMELPFDDNSFDIVTAFETVYFWSDLPESFKKICHVMKIGGTFFICNESNGETDKDDKWVKSIGDMTIHTGEQIKEVILQAGFSDVQIQKNRKGWLCVTARKGERGNNRAKVKPYSKSEAISDEAIQYNGNELCRLQCQN
jgi:SAM-dependent methyltransferase